MRGICRKTIWLILNIVCQERNLSELSQSHLLRLNGIRNHIRNSSKATNTRKRVRELRSANLSLTMSEIANSVGISRQRVFQILREEELPTQYHVIFEKFQYPYQCLVCGTVSPHKFCSDECKKKWQQVPVICTKCGKLFSGI